MVTCLGDLGVLGHKDGTVGIIDYLSRDIQIICKHNHQQVIQIVGVDVVGHGKYKLFSSRNGALSNHHHLISIGKDNKMRVYPMKELTVNYPPYSTSIPTTSKPISIHTYSSNVACYLSNGQIEIWRMTAPSVTELSRMREPLKIVLMTVIDLRNDVAGCLGFWNFQVNIFKVGCFRLLN